MYAYISRRGLSKVTFMLHVTFVGMVTGCGKSQSDRVQGPPAQSTAQASTVQSASQGTQPKKLIGHSDMVLSLAFSRNGETLASASADRTVNLWDVQTGRVKQTMRGHTSSVWSVAMSPDGKMLASGSLDGTFRLWDTQNGRLLRTIAHPGSVSTVSFAPNGKLIASGGVVEVGKSDRGVGGVVNLWDVQTGKQVRTLKLPHSAKSVTFSPNSQLLFVGMLAATVKLWDVQTGKVVSTFTGYQRKDGRVQGGPVTLSSDGKAVAGTGSGTVKRLNQLWIWNAQTGTLLHTLQVSQRFTRGLAFSPNGQILASASLLKVQLWDVRTGKQLKSWGDENGIHSIAFTPDGKHLATGSREGEWPSNIRGVIKLWPVK